MQVVRREPMLDEHPAEARRDRHVTDRRAGLRLDELAAPVELLAHMNDP